MFEMLSFIYPRLKTFEQIKIEKNLEKKNRMKDSEFSNCTSLVILHRVVFGYLCNGGMQSRRFGLSTML